MVDTPALPSFPFPSAADSLDTLGALLPDLERLSGRHAAAEAAILNRSAGTSHWLESQVNRDVDLVDFCADAETLAMILRGRFLVLAEQQGIASRLFMSDAGIDPSPWRRQAQRCAVDLPPDLVVREATALLVWAIRRLTGGPL